MAYDQEYIDYLVKSGELITSYEASDYLKISHKTIKEGTKVLQDW